MSCWVLISSKAYGFETMGAEDVVMMSIGGPSKHPKSYSDFEITPGTSVSRNLKKSSRYSGGKAFCRYPVMSKAAASCGRGRPGGPCRISSSSSSGRASCPSLMVMVASAVFPPGSKGRVIEPKSVFSGRRRGSRDWFVSWIVAPKGVGVVVALCTSSGEPSVAECGRTTVDGKMSRSEQQATVRVSSGCSTVSSFRRRLSSRCWPMAAGRSKVGMTADGLHGSPRSRLILPRKLIRLISPAFMTQRPARKLFSWLLSTM